MEAEEEAATAAATAATKQPQERRVGGLEARVVELRDCDSSLLDRFERVSFEVQLNRALMGRSYSTPNPARLLFTPPQPAAFACLRSVSPSSGSPRRRRPALCKAVKKLLRPVFVHHHGPEKDPNPD